MIKLRVKDLLKEKGKTQKELAELLGMTEVGLSKSINEDGNPPFKRLQEIADALNVDFIELFVPQREGLTGYIEHNGEVHKINSIDDIKKLLSDIENVKE